MLCLCALLIANPALASSEKIAASLKAAAPAARVSVLIHFKNPRTDEQHQRLQSLGAERKGSPVNAAGSPTKDTESYTVSASVLDEIAKDANVVAISRDDAQPAMDAAQNAAASNAAVQPLQKISQDLQNLDPGKTVNVIVQYTDGPSDANHQVVTAQGGSHIADVALVKGAVYSVSASSLDQIARNPKVVHISPDRQIRRTMDHYNYATNDNVAFSEGWDGTGIGVAVIDSGVYGHPDLNTYNQSSSRIVYSQSFVTGDSNTSDEYGHGTHVAGILAGNGASSAASSGYATEYQGIAPNAQIVNL